MPYVPVVGRWHWILTALGARSHPTWSQYYPMNYLKELNVWSCLLYQTRVVQFLSATQSYPIYCIYTISIYIANYFCQGFDVWRTCSWRWRVILKSCDMMNSLWMNAQIIPPFVWNPHCIHYKEPVSCMIILWLNIKRQASSIIKWIVGGPLIAVYVHSKRSSSSSSHIPTRRLCWLQ